MKILHYFLGFPPYRSGGLTKYAVDLMRQQYEDGNHVMALWPGHMRIIDSQVKIKRSKDYYGVESFELINPLPVALDEGIKDVNEYMKGCSRQVFDEFLRGLQSDVIHIHTLMGLYKEFLDAAEEQKIYTVFTTHDYYGICPKVTLYRNGDVCKGDNGCRDCIQCNGTALSLRKIVMMQSPIYRYLKNSFIVKTLRRKHRSVFFESGDIPVMPDVKADDIADNYRKLRKYYIEMFEQIDMIHFNSSVAKNVYEKFLSPQNGVIVSITHSGINDNRTLIKSSGNEILHITSLSPAKAFKGFNVLRRALDELWRSGYRSFELKVFSPVKEPSEYMKIKEDGYDYSDLATIFSDTDVLVAPSIWYETFGFTVLEALSYGIPVIVSDRVGAKDIIGDGGIIIEAGNVEQLKETIISLKKERLELLKQKVIESVSIKSWRTFVDEMYQLYSGLLI